jgi:opacity protein-like surface antigen
MKPKLLAFLVLAAFVALLRPVASAADGASANVRAILVLASNQKGGSDGRLAAYEPTLRRILRFESYKLAGEGSASLGGGKANVQLGRGHILELESEKSEGKGKGGGVRVRVNWQLDGQSQINTGLVLKPGVPAVLGGPANGAGGEVWAVILVAG